MDRTSETTETTTHSTTTTTAVDHVKPDKAAHTHAKDRRSRKKTVTNESAQTTGNKIGIVDHDHHNREIVDHDHHNRETNPDS